MPPLLVLRPPLWLRAISTALFVCVALVVLGAGLDAGGISIPMGSVSGAALALIAVRNWRLSIVATPAGLTFRNLWRTHAFTWDEVDDVLPGVDEVVLRLKGGREVTASAFSRPPGSLPAVGRRNREAAARLRSVVRRRRRPGQ